MRREELGSRIWRTSSSTQVGQANLEGCQSKKCHVSFTAQENAHKSNNITSLN